MIEAAGLSREFAQANRAGCRRARGLAFRIGPASGEKSAKEETVTGSAAARQATRDSVDHQPRVVLDKRTI